MGRYVLAYDFGTGGIKASVYNYQGNCLADHFASYETHYPRAGWHEQNPEHWWSATIEATRKLLDEWEGCSEDVEAIGISGHSLGVIPVNENGSLLREYTPIWSDSRPDTQPEDFFKNVSEEQWYLTTGNGFPASLYPVFKIMWLRDNEPDVFKQIYKVLGSKDYINFRMTGVMTTDYSYASGSGVWDLNGWKYNKELIDAASLNDSIFPEAVESSQVIGNLTPKAAEELGLSRLVKVVAGGVDNSCMALGARAFRDGDVYNSMGSSSWIAVTDNKPLLNKFFRPYVFAHIVPGKFTSAIGVFSTGSSFRWLREHLFTNLDVCARDEDKTVYEKMLEMAANVKIGANGVMFLPSMAGGSSLDPGQNVRGAFVQLDLGTTQADMCRAAIEGIAISQTLALRALESLTTLSDEMLAVGGGNRSDLWMQIYADLYRKKMIRTNVGQQAAALGAATAALVGIGQWSDYSPINDIHEVVDIKEPIAEHSNQYERIIEVFSKLNGYLCEIGDDIFAIDNGQG